MTDQTTTGDQPASRGSRLTDYTRHIEKLCQDPGARTALRTGLRRGLDDVPRMHRFIAAWLPRGRYVPQSEQLAFYAVAAMIASQPRHQYATTDSGEDTGEPPAAADGAPQPRYGTSLGHAFAAAVIEGPGRDREMRESTAESRLNLLTRQSTSGLHRHLPAAVRYLREVGVSVDWARLLSDLIAWPADSKKISRRWLQDYYIQRSKALRDIADRADQEETIQPAAS
jgi:CRISPR system Cascade subunit CasB